MKYTRGPWKWDEQNNWVRLGNGCVIPFAKDTKADGILVAAAPDMYEALKECRILFALGANAIHKKAINWDEKREKAREIERKVHDAISKAEGRP